jgi:iron complex outermembrane recepter protein
MRETAAHCRGPRAIRNDATGRTLMTISQRQCAAPRLHVRGAVGALAAIALSGASIAVSAPASPQVEDLGGLSLEALSKVQVTSVSKSSEALRQAPAAIYVITHDDIVRSGATSLPEVLRLAPNLLVTQLTASAYTVSARGFGGNPDVQNFANKLLILIDGRSVYSPLYSGVYYDAQDVVFDDVDRIEVISGPGATLWGANAMNGVINIITRPAHLTDGTLIRVGAGNLEQNFTARYGGVTDGGIAFRVYGKAFGRDAMALADGAGAQDDWYKGQGGFRLDWSRQNDVLTVQGDVYRGLQNQAGQGQGLIVGGNALGRWQRRTRRGSLQLQAYVDETQRSAPADGVAFVLHTYDVELQHTLSVGTRHDIVWGAGERLNDYDIRNSATLLFEPPGRDLSLGNVFAQDTFALAANWKLTFGLKLENNPYTGWEAQPDARLAWRARESTLLWAAASHAIRSPTPFDVDVVEKVGTTVFLTGNPDFQPERVWAYEIGYRGVWLSRFSLSASVFYNEYDDLRSIEPDPATFTPLRWDNLIEGHSYGMTAWADWQVTPWWRLSPGFTTQHKALRASAGASGLLGVSQTANDPHADISLKSAMDLGRSATVDLSLRYVGALPQPALPAYYDLSVRFGWRVSDKLEAAITGANLLDARHLEYPAPAGEEIRRSVIATLRWKLPR